MLAAGSMAVHWQCGSLGVSELTGPGADIEKVADIGHVRSHKRHYAGDIVGCVDGRGIKCERINVGSRQWPLGRIGRRDGQGQLAAASRRHREL
jgi:hypothetical protein